MLRVSSWNIIIPRNGDRQICKRAWMLNTFPAVAVTVWPYSHRPDGVSRAGSFPSALFR